MHFNSLRPAPCVFTPWVSSGLSVGSGCSLVAVRRQVFFLFWVPSVQFSHSVVFHSWRSHGLQHARPPSITNSWSLLKLMSFESVIPSNHLILCHPLLLPPSMFPSIRVFSNESLLPIRWPKYWNFSFSIVLPMNIQDGFPLGLDWLDLLAVQGALKSLLQHYSSKASILWCSAFFIVQLSHPYMTTGKNHSFDWMDLHWQSNVSAF